MRAHIYRALLVGRKIKSVIAPQPRIEAHIIIPPGATTLPNASN